VVYVNNDSRQLKSVWEIMLPRADVHNLWNRRSFSIVPKKGATSGDLIGALSHLWTKFIQSITIDRCCLRQASRLPDG